jgi:hypothetical protein
LVSPYGGRNRPAGVERISRGHALHAVLDFLGEAGGVEVLTQCSHALLRA